MNNVVLIGRLVREPEIRYSTGENSTVAGSFTLAVDRRFKRTGEPTADFIRCICFGKTAEFAEKYLSKGTKIAVNGRIQTGSYKNKNGETVYTTDVVADNLEFVESKSAGQQAQAQRTDADGFMEIPESIDEELPFA